MFGALQIVYEGFVFVLGAILAFLDVIDNYIYLIYIYV